MLLSRFIFFFSVLCGSLNGYSQNVSHDRLESLEYEELLTLFDEVRNDSVPAEKVARAYLNRARKEGDTIKMARGYDRLARIFHPEKNIAFADSLIQLTKDIHHITYPALGHILKATQLSKIQNLPRANQEMYLAFEEVQDSENVIHELFILYDLIYDKSYWGDKNEALKLQRYRHDILLQSDIKDRIRLTTRPEALEFVDDIYVENLLLSYLTYITCYINLEEYKLAQEYLEKATILVSTDFEGSNSIIAHYCEMFRLELAFHTNNAQIFREIESRLLHSNRQDIKASSYFDLFCFSGILNLKQNNEELGVKQLLKADSIFRNERITILPYRREVFKLLLEHYKKMNDKDKQIEYYQKLSKIDSVFKINFKYFESEVTNQIEVPLLLSEKNSRIDSLQEQQKESEVFINWLWLGITIFLSANFFLIRKHLLFKKRIRRLMKSTNASHSEINATQQKESLSELTSELVKEIMDKFDRFEQAQQYRNPDLTLHKLAKKFKTNARYLSKVVNFKKEKNFSQYLNDLRVDYSVDALRNDPNYRKYTIKAIAELSGFNSAESYSRAFKKKFGIHPSYFVRELLKNKSKENFGDSSILPQQID